MDNVKTYKKLLNKFSLTIKRKYNADILIEFNGHNSMFSINKGSSIQYTNIPTFLVEIKTLNNTDTSNILSSFRSIEDTFNDSFLLKYKLNGRHYFPPHTLDFLY